MRSWLAMVFFVLGCGAGPTTGAERASAPEPDPRVDLLTDELQRPDTLADPDLQLEMPELGSELPPVIFVPPADPPEDR